MNMDSPFLWPYPGSLWWKFDFHTHTPASLDTDHWQQAIDTDDEVTPEKWLRKYMEARIDCVAVTDHNSGAWIDQLKVTYGEMKKRAGAGTPTDEFRELTLFPGVEISGQGGVHILAIFDPSASASDIDHLLGKVDYDGTRGKSDGESKKGIAEVLQAILDSKAIPIPAHADSARGLLRVKPGTHQSELSAPTILQALEVDGLLAVEKVDPAQPWPECAAAHMDRLATVVGSDCHSFRGDATPGSRYTWIKMATPTVEGLRLALLDGNGVSVRRSDDGVFEPLETPKHFITGIEIESARFMGNRKAERLDFTPYYNALIGGRGTGKSTIVHALRLGYRRDQELRRLGEETEPYRQFTSFIQPVKSRGGRGALRDTTEIRIHLMRDGIIHRLRWRIDGQDAVVEEQDEHGDWCASASQDVTPDRFPVRVFSQGQIAAMAGASRQALLDVIDAAANVGSVQQRFEEAKRTYFSQRAGLREIEVRLEIRPELERQRADLNRQLVTLQQSHHADVLKTHQHAQRQRREVDNTLEQLQAVPDRIMSFGKDIVTDDWPDEAFDPAADEDAITWKTEVGITLRETRQDLAGIANTLSESMQTLRADQRLAAWRTRADEAKTDYHTLQATLAERGVADPHAFGRLMKERQQLEEQLKELDRLEKDKETREDASEHQWNRVLDARKAITVARKNFVEATLGDNKFVRMNVVPFGFEARNIERDLRKLLDCEDDRFEHDILKVEAGEVQAGVAYDLARAPTEEREAVLEDVKQRLIGIDGDFRGPFRNYLRRKMEKSEFEDHVRCWFSDDDLDVEYSRTGDGKDWSAITQGSQGQRSAALLAFLLAFGDEPLILDQPEDDLDNHLIYGMIVQQIRENKRRRQLIIVTHNPNVVVNGDSEMVHAFEFGGGQCRVKGSGALQEHTVREEVCRVMEGGREAFTRRWARLGREV